VSLLNFIANQEPRCLAALAGVLGFQLRGFRMTLVPRLNSAPMEAYGCIPFSLAN
jgi:hypothetical protein